MKNIIITVGISGSGKSTWAHQQWLLDPKNTVIVNRDKLRELLFGYNESNINEYYQLPTMFRLEKEVVNKYEDTLINEALSENKTVIVDATHLHLDYIKRFEYWNVPITLQIFTISLNEAIERDSKRLRQVGADVITKQYDKFVSLVPKIQAYTFVLVSLIQNSTLPPVVLLDLDGTIALKGDRSPFDWKRVGEDLVEGQIRYISNKLPIIVCTGRDAVCKPETEAWLKDNQIQYQDIYFRAENDMRPDWIVKEEMWKEISKSFYIVGLLDDRLQVVRRARALGLKVCNVEYNNF